MREIKTDRFFILEMKKRSRRVNVNEEVDSDSQQSQQPTQSVEVIEDDSLASEQRVGVFNIFDRRINVHELGRHASMFELCRAWVQDDPDRQKVLQTGK